MAGTCAGTLGKATQSQAGLLNKRRVRIPILLEKYLKSLLGGRYIAFHLISSRQVDRSRPVVGLLLKSHAELFDRFVRHLLAKIKNPEIVMHLRKTGLDSG